MNKTIQTYCQIILFIFLSTYISFGIHSHTDEYLQFGTLQYLNPNFHLNLFPLGFDSFSKILPFDFKLHTSYYYVGNIQAYLFYPFYLLFPLELAKSIYSLISLVVLFILIQKSFNLSVSKRWILIGCLPLYLTILHDGGPVNIGLMCFLLSKILIEKILNQPIERKTYFFSFLLFFIWSAAFFDKLFFLYLFPGILIFSFVNISFEAIKGKQIAFIGFPILFLIGFIAWYLFTDFEILINNNAHPTYFKASTNLIIGGSSDFSEVLKFLKTIPTTIPENSSINNILEDRVYVLKGSLSSLNFSFYFLRNLYPWFYPNAPITFYIFLLFLGSLIAFNYRAIKENLQNKKVIKPLLYLSSFFMTIIVFLLIGKVRFSHHFIFLWIPLLGFLLDNEFKFQKNIFFLLFFLFNCFTGLANIFLSKPLPHLNDGYASIAKYTQRENPKLLIVNFDSWDYLNQRKIDNPNNHIVTQVDPRDSVLFKRLVKLSDSLKIPIIEVSNKFDLKDNYEKNSLESKLDIIKKYGYVAQKMNQSSNSQIFYLKKERK